MKYVTTYLKKCSQTLGSMRIKNMSDYDTDSYINTAIYGGYNCFYHTDIYGGGRYKEVFGDALEHKKTAREINH